MFRRKSTPWMWLQRRLLSSTLKKTRIVPYRLTEEHAVDLFHQWAQEQPLAPMKLSNMTREELEECRSVYLPFYVFDVTATTSFTGDVGTVRLRYNPQTRRSELHTQWESLRVAASTVEYPSDLGEMQVYASYTFKRDLTQTIKLPGVSSLSRPLTSQQLQGAKEVDSRGMDIGMAKKVVDGRVRDLEQRRGEQLLLSASQGGVKVRHVRMQTRLQRRVYSVYLPSYIFGYSHLGHTFRVFVNGFDGRYFGQPQYSAVKVGAAVFAAGSSILSILSSIGDARFSLGSFIVSIVLPSIVCGVGAQWSAVGVHRWREQRRLWEEQREAEFRSSSGYQEQQTRTQDDQERSKRYERAYNYSSSSSSRRGRSQHTSLYETLGVSPSASVDEISNKFRMLALKNHPDVVHDPALKRDASAKFQRILKAYQVLRDPKKRAEYDLTGQVPA